MYHLLCYKWVIIFDVLFSSFTVLTFCLLLLHDYKTHFKHFFSHSTEVEDLFFYPVHTDKALMKKRVRNPNTEDTIIQINESPFPTHTKLIALTNTISTSTISINFKNLS